MATAGALLLGAAAQTGGFEGRECAQRSAVCWWAPQLLLLLRRRRQQLLVVKPHRAVVNSVQLLLVVLVLLLLQSWEACRRGLPLHAPSLGCLLLLLLLQALLLLQVLLLLLHALHLQLLHGALAKPAL
jgi:hypothetical protein